MITVIFLHQRHCITNGDIKNSTPKFLIKMDDDSNISYEDLAAKLRSEDLHSPHQANIYCPSVLKNQKLWRHKGAPIMGKWAYLSDNFTSQSSRITCCGTLVLYLDKCIRDLPA